MKRLLFTFAVIPTVLFAAETMRPQPLTLADLEPFTCDEVFLLIQLGGIEQNLAVVEQARHEAEIPLDAFGGN